MTTNKPAQPPTADIISNTLKTHSVRWILQGPPAHYAVGCKCMREFHSMDAFADHQVEAINIALHAATDAEVASESGPFEAVAGIYEDAEVIGQFATRIEATLAIGQYVLDNPDKYVSLRHFSITEV